MFPLKPLNCCFSSMLRSLSCWKVNLHPSLKSLENWNMFHLRISLYLSPSHHSFNSDQFPSPCQWKTFPQHNAATTMLHCGDGILGVMRGVGFVPDIAFSLMAKKINFSLIWPEYLLPNVWGVSHMPFSKHQTYFLIFFLKQCFFSVHSSVKPNSVECMA